MRAKFELCQRKRDCLLMLRHRIHRQELRQTTTNSANLSSELPHMSLLQAGCLSNPRHTALFYLFHAVKRGDKLSSPPLSLSLSLVSFISIARKRVPLIVLVFITPTYQSSQPNARLPAGRLCLPSPHCYFSQTSEQGCQENT